MSRQETRLQGVRGVFTDCLVPLAKALHEARFRSYSGFCLFNCLVFF